MRRDSDFSDLALRIEEFKKDPERMREVTEYLDGILEEAMRETDLKCVPKKTEPFPPVDQEPDTGMKRRLGRARTFIVRMFDAFCNCTQTAAAAARTTARTNNPFSKR